MCNVLHESIPALAGLPQRYAEVIPLLVVVGILLFLLGVAVSYLMASFERYREIERRSLTYLFQSHIIWLQY